MKTPTIIMTIFVALISIHAFSQDSTIPAGGWTLAEFDIEMNQFKDSENPRANYRFSGKFECSGDQLVDALHQAKRWGGKIPDRNLVPSRHPFTESLAWRIRPEVNCGERSVSVVGSNGNSFELPIFNYLAIQELDISSLSGVVRVNVINVDNNDTDASGVFKESKSDKIDELIGPNRGQGKLITSFEMTAPIQCELSSRAAQIRVMGMFKREKVETKTVSDLTCIVGPEGEGGTLRMTTEIHEW